MQNKFQKGRGVAAEVSLDWEQFEHKPSSKLQYKDQVDKFGTPRTETRVIGARLGSQIEQVTPKSLARYVSRGQTWSPFTFNECPQWKRPRRLEGLFKSCKIVSLDFDSGESIEEITSQGEKLGFKFNIIHHSFSSTSDHPKLRGIIFLESEVVAFDKARLYSESLPYAFPNADKACVDVARLYFGSTPGSIVLVDDKQTCSIALLEEVAKGAEGQSRLVKTQRNVAKPENTEWGDSKLQRAVLAKLSPAKRAYVKRKALGILKDIETFDGKSGSRYNCLWKSASRLARMPEVVGSAVYEWTRDAVSKNSHFEGWDKDPDEVIMNAIEWSADHADDPV